MWALANYEKGGDLGENDGTDIMGAKRTYPKTIDVVREFEYRRTWCRKSFGWVRSSKSICLFSSIWYGT